MKNNESPEEFCKRMGEVLNELSEIVVKEIEESYPKSRDFLTKSFANDIYSFCRFVGFAHCEITKGGFDTPVPDRILTAIVMAGLAFGVEEGFANGKRVYKGDIKGTL